MTGCSRMFRRKTPDERAVKRPMSKHPSDSGYSTSMTNKSAAPAHDGCQSVPQRRTGSHRAVDSTTPGSPRRENNRVDCAPLPANVRRSGCCSPSLWNNRPPITRLFALRQKSVVIQRGADEDAPTHPRLRARHLSTIPRTHLPNPPRTTNPAASDAGARKPLDRETTAVQVPKHVRVVLKWCRALDWGLVNEPIIAGQRPI